MKFLTRLQDKLELYRLEQKYTRRKNRSTFTTGAQYVDGEYVYSSTPVTASPTSVTSSPKFSAASPSTDRTMLGVHAHGRGAMNAATASPNPAANRSSRLWGR